MEAKKRDILSIIGLILLFLLLVVVVYFLYFYDFTEKKDKPKVEDPGQVQLPSSPDDEEGREDPDDFDFPDDAEYSDSTVKLQEKDDFSEIDLKKLATLIAERIGSYSSHSNFDNFKDLETFMSDNMKQWTTNFVQEQKESSEWEEDFYRIITKAVTTEVRSFNSSAGTASVLVETQRQETKNQEETVMYQSLILNFIKESEGWKVDRVNWQ